MRSAALFAVVLTLASCTDATSPSEGLAARSRALSNTATTDTLVVEGEPQAVTFREVRGSSFPLPFEARVPSPMAVVADTAGGATVRLTLGAPPADAAWSLVVLDAGLNEAAARDAARTAAEAQGTATPDASAPAWAAEAFRTERDGRVGTVWLGRHADRYFTVTTDAAAETLDGFGPREAYVRENWRWLDDGSTLGG